MNQYDLKLWDALEKFTIGPKDAMLSFEKRLARENNWSLEYASRAVIEYKKFIFLAVARNIRQTPSDQVDQVWHLHLTYTQSYWKDLCGGILKRELHHGPTKGGQQQNELYLKQYQQTLEEYQRVFGNPPVDFWPDAKKRFKNINGFVRTNKVNHWIIKKPEISIPRVSFMVGSSLLLTACASFFNDDGDLNFLVVGLVVVGVYLFFKGIAYLLKHGGGGGGGCGSYGSCSSGDGGGCGSGCGS